MKGIFLFKLTWLFYFGFALQSIAQPVTLPYTQNWESGQGSWVLVNDTFTNKWHIGTGTADSGVRSLYISNDGGNTNVYTSAEAVVHAYVDIAFTSGALGYNLSFKWKGVGEANQDYMRVWLVPTSYTPVAGNPISSAAVTGAVNLSGDLRGKSSWQAAEYFIPSSWAGNGRLVYEWRNNGPTPASIAINPPAAVDNIYIQASDCLAPQDIDSASVSGTSATILWNKPGQVPANGYEYSISTSNSLPSGPGAATSDTFFTSSFAAGTKNYVYIRSKCSSTSYSTWALYTLDMPVPNDVPAAAITLTVGAGCPATLFAIGNATLTPGEPYPSCSGTAQSPVWFKFVAPASGAVQVSTDHVSSTFNDSKIAIFSAADPSDFNTFSIVACDDDNGKNVNNGLMSVAFATGLVPGNTYYIAVDKSENSVASGNFCITVNDLSASTLSANNNCASAYQQPFANASTEASAFKGWVGFADESGNLIAAVRNLKGGNITDFSASQYVHSGATRSDGDGTLYMDRNFHINYTGSNDSFLVSLFFRNDELTDLGTNTSLNDLRVTKFNSISCVENVEDANQSGSSLLTPVSTGTAGTINWVTIFTTGFSEFFLAASNTPLPILMKNLRVYNQDAWNIITWETLSEQWGDKMELEHSIDGAGFVRIAVIPSKGEASSYTYYDKAPVQGRNYYRLALIDKGGVRHYSKVVSAFVAAPSQNFSVRAYPNPVTAGQTTILVSGDAYDNSTIVIKDITGKEVATGTPVEGARTTLHIGHLSPGIYVAEYKSPRHFSTIKLIKK